MLNKRRSGFARIVGIPLLKKTLVIALVAGTPLAVFVCLSTFQVLDFSLWMGIQNILFIITLCGAFMIGYWSRGKQISFQQMLWGLVCYAFVIFILYLGSYLLTIGLFEDKMKWIPFFQKDYTHHGFTSPKSYLDHESNFVDLLILQVFSVLISSIFYFLAGITGYLFNIPFQLEYR